MSTTPYTRAFDPSRKEADQNMIDESWGKYVGKVRDVYPARGLPYAVIDHSDRVSSFDSILGNVENKGIVLNYLNVWWMNQTRHIIDNHMLYHNQRYAVVKKCRRIDIEVIVRGYITGNSDTSLWTQYSKGNDVYGLELPAGLRQHQKLSAPVITPTTKGDQDIPLRDSDVTEESFDITREEWAFIKEKALALFNYGSMIAASKGLILVDTKYEFGFDKNGNIILIDELHTGDSSRYWEAESYNNRLNNNENPICFDKDHIRRYVLSVDPNFKSTPLNQRIVPEIPQEIKDELLKSYHTLYARLSGNTLDREFEEARKNELSMCQFLSDYRRHHAPVGIILSGSHSDMDKIKRVKDELYKNGVMSDYYIGSAHKEIEKVMSTINYYNDTYGKRKLVFITVVGMSNGLGGVLAGHTKFPVINCPNFKDTADMMVNVHSSLQMPSRVPGCVVLRPDNAAMLAKYILNL